MKRNLTLPATVVAATAAAIGVAAAPAAAAAPLAPVAPEPVPADFLPWIEKAAQTCDGVTPGLLAAQIQSESSFRTDAVSPSNAMGPSQFIPETWRLLGVDADGDGVRNPFSIADAVTTQAVFMCENIANTTAGVRNGSLSGDPVDLALAAYNAGFGAVQQHGGMPSGGEYSTQTQPYVEKIRALERLFNSILRPLLGPVR